MQYQQYIMFEKYSRQVREYFQEAYNAAIEFDYEEPEGSAARFDAIVELMEGELYSYIEDQRDLPKVFRFFLSELGYRPGLPYSYEWVFQNSIERIASLRQVVDDMAAEIDGIGFLNPQIATYVESIYNLTYSGEAATEKVQLLIRRIAIIVRHTAILYKEVLDQLDGFSDETKLAEVSKLKRDLRNRLGEALDLFVKTTGDYYAYFPTNELTGKIIDHDLIHLKDIVGFLRVDIKIANRAEDLQKQVVGKPIVRDYELADLRTELESLIACLHMYGHAYFGGGVSLDLLRRSFPTTNIGRRSGVGFAYLSETDLVPRLSINALTIIRTLILNAAEAASFKGGVVELDMQLHSRAIERFGFRGDLLTKAEVLDISDIDHSLVVRISNPLAGEDEEDLERRLVEFVSIFNGYRDAPLSETASHGLELALGQLKEPIGLDDEHEVVQYALCREDNTLHLYIVINSNKLNS